LLTPEKKLRLKYLLEFLKKIRTVSTPKTGTKEKQSKEENKKRKIPRPFTLKYNNDMALDV